MSKVTVIFGSTTGNTESAAEVIAESFDAKLVEVSNATEQDLQSELIILGCSTWGLGELQDDWDGAVELIENLDLSGKKVALFGSGDGSSFSDTFVDALGTLYDKVVEAGAEVIGSVAVDEYDFDDSTAVRDGKFIGLPLDEENQSDLSEDRIIDWITKLKSEL